MLSAPLFIIYTNDCTATRDGVEIVKYADDTAIVGLISQDEFNYQYEVSNFDNFLHLNTSKTKEIVFDFRTSKRSELMPIKQAQKYPGATGDFALGGALIAP